MSAIKTKLWKLIQTGLREDRDMERVMKNVMKLIEDTPQCSQKTDTNKNPTE